MLRDWKKRQSRLEKDCMSRYGLGNSLCFVIHALVKPILFLAIISFSPCYALPNIPSFMDCEDIIFNAGFQNDSQPSNGTSGATGYQTRVVFSNSQNRTYYVYVPSTYNDAKPIPIMIVYHGASGAGTASINAQYIRSIWQSTAEEHNFIVMAQVATGGSGGWIPGTAFSILSDILDDMYLDYNIEKARIYGHGFSAGGHVMHTLMLNNSTDFADYIVSAGVLEAHAGLSAPTNVSRVVPVFASIGLSDIFGQNNLLNLTQSNHIVFNNAGWVDDKTYWIDEFVGGHVIDAQLPQKSWAKLCPFSKWQ